MAAREMVIGKFINQIGFRIDHSTVQQVKNTVESVKSGIKTVQGVADEVKKSVNDNIDEIQKKAQKARSETEKPVSYTHLDVYKRQGLLYTKDADKMYHDVPMAFLQHAPQDRNLEIVINCEGRDAGMVIPYPLSACLVYGL